MHVARWPSSTPRRGAGGIAVVLAGSLLAACGGGTSVSSKATTTSSTTSTTTGAPTTTGGGSGSAACATSQLSVSFGMVGAGAGNRQVQVILTNHGAVACSMIGYVGMRLLGPGNQAIPTNVVRDGPGTPSTVVVAPGAPASGSLHWGAIAGTGESQTGPCEATPQQVEVTPPNQVQPLTVGWSFGPVCEQGRIDAGPLQLGVPASGQ